MIATTVANPHLQTTPHDLAVSLIVATLDDLAALLSLQDLKGSSM